jgi:hypothetical protein
MVLYRGIDGLQGGEKIKNNTRNVVSVLLKKSNVKIKRENILVRLNYYLKCRRDKDGES